MPPSTAPAAPQLLSGTAFALAAGLMWGLVFVAPLMLPAYPPALLAVGRYLAFGLLCLPLALLDRQDLRALCAADWWEAAKLSAIGNFLYYLCLAAAIQRAGNPLVSVIIGTLPVVIAVASNRRNAQRDGHLPWGRLAPSLAAIGLGIACVNHTEAAGLAAQRRSEANLAAMRRAIADFAQAVEEGRDAVAADFQLHTEIARATQNEHFAGLMATLGARIIPRARLDPAEAIDPQRQAYLRRVNAEHESIVDAIAAQDVEAARAAMRTHLANSRERRRRAVADPQ